MRGRGREGERERESSGQSLCDDFNYDFAQAIGHIRHQHKEQNEREYRSLDQQVVYFIHKLAAILKELCRCNSAKT